MYIKSVENSQIHLPAIIFTVVSGASIYSLFNLLHWSITKFRKFLNNDSKYIKIIDNLTKRIELLEQQINTLNTSIKPPFSITPSSITQIKTTQIKKGGGCCDPEYLKFQSATMDKFRKEHPNMSRGDVRKAIYDMWKKS